MKRSVQASYASTMSRRLEICDFALGSVDSRKTTVSEELCFSEHEKAEPLSLRKDHF